jgi:RsiW-degrading membrane proteinase PrsW (M82 family)
MNYMKKAHPVLLLILGLVASYFLVRFLVPEPKSDTFEEKYAIASDDNKWVKAWSIAKEAVESDPLNMDFHYNLIISSSNVDPTLVDGKPILKQTKNLYTEYSTSDLQIRRDIGNYGLGLIHSLEDQYQEAIDYFQRVRSDLKYLNNSMGHCYISLGNEEKAEFHLKQEIAIGGNIEGAIRNLHVLYSSQENSPAIIALYEEQKAEEFITPRQVRQHYFSEGRTWAYIKSTIAGGFQNTNLLGLLGAFLITLIWFVYLRKIDLYEKDDFRPSALALLLGMLFVFGVFIINDLIGDVFILADAHKLFALLVYTIFGVGFIEEFVKIIPLVLILRYTNYVREPYDYILYACLSALGFAFIENLYYLDESRLNIMHGRGLLAAVIHMVCASIAAYGLILNKYRPVKRPVLNFLLYFSIASVVHGIWDFLALADDFPANGWLGILFFVTLLTVWNSLKNNALNQSEFFDKEKEHDIRQLSRYLVLSLGGLLIFEFIAVSIQLGPGRGTRAFFSSIIGGSYLMFFLSGRLGRFQLAKGEWNPIKLTHENPDYDYGSIVGKPVKLEPFSKNREAARFLPNMGIILERKTIRSQHDWYLVELERPAENTRYLSNKVFIRAKETADPINKKTAELGFFYLIPKNLDLTSGSIKQRDLYFAYWVRAKVES